MPNGPGQILGKSRLARKPPRCLGGLIGRSTGLGRKQVRCLVLNRFASHQSDIAVFGNSDIGNAPSPNAPKHNFGIGLARFVRTGSAQLDLCLATTLAKIEDVNRCYRFGIFFFSFRRNSAWNDLSVSNRRWLMPRNSKRRSWTPSEVRSLKTLARKKTRAGSIARTLKRTEGATRQKAFSLGLSLDSRA